MTSNMDVSLPAGWVIAGLSDLASINPRFDRSILDDSTPVTFVPMSSVDVGFAGIQRPETRTYSEVKKGYTAFVTGDVIFAKITPCMENGKGGVVKGELDQPFFGSTEFHVFRPRREVNANWIAYYLSQEQFRRSARLKMKGSAGQLRVPTTFLENVALPLPPADEQTRILDHIDELFTDLDAGVAALVRVQKKLKRYRAALLHAAVTGRLTADWRAKHGDGGESGKQLLKRILVARRKDWEERTLADYEAKERTPPTGWESRYPEPVLPELEGVTTIPSSWSTASLEQLCFVSSGTTPKRGQERFWSNGIIPWVTSTVVNDEYVDEASEFVTVEALNETGLRLYPVGTLLIALYGEGKTRGKVSELRIESTINQAMAAMTWFAESHPLTTYIKCVLAEMYEKLRREAAGGVQPNLNAGIVKKVEIPLPPKKEADVVVDLVDQRMSQIDTMQNEVNRGLRRASRLRQAILKAAFEGKLVPQNPDDEPAAELLARIQAEVNAEVDAAPKRTTRKRKAAKRKTQSADGR